VVGRNGRAELTAREVEVLELLGAGLTTAEVAKQLEISAVTVRRHTAETVRKLGVRDRDEAIDLVRDAL
jgi:DNA-binding NarL/FixJ family response regulator